MWFDMKMIGTDIKLFNWLRLANNLSHHLMGQDFNDSTETTDTSDIAEPLISLNAGYEDWELIIVLNACLSMFMAIETIRLKANCTQIPIFFVKLFD